MTNLTSNEEIEKLLKDYPRLAHEQAELKQAIATLLVKSRIEAYGHGLYTGAMPESIGKPIAKDYIAELEAHITSKEKSGE